MGLIRILIGSFLAQHGVVHAALWWLLGGSRVDDGRWGMMVLTVAVTLLYVGAGIGLIVDVAWWRVPTGVGALLSLLLVGLSVPSGWLGPVVLVDGVLLWVLVGAHHRRQVGHAMQRHGRDHGRQVSRVHGR